MSASLLARGLSVVVAVALAGCASNRSASVSSPAEAAKPEGAGDGEKARQDHLKRSSLRREQPIAKEKREKAARDLKNEESVSQGTLSKARAELELAQKRLATFDDREAPARRARAQLQLQGAKDGLADAEEELQQLELMYKDQDLADKTKEIVIRRSQRQLERTRQRLDLEQKDLATLEGFTLVMDRAKLLLDVDDKRRDLDRAERAAVSGVHEKRIALLSAESDLARVEAEIAALPPEAR